jgi:hypothetical protein
MRQTIPRKDLSNQESVEANTPDSPDNGLKIESDPASDDRRSPTVMLVLKNTMMNVKPSLT